MKPGYKGHSKIISKGKTPPQSGVMKGKMPAKTEFQKILDHVPKSKPK